LHFQESYISYSIIDVILYQCNLPVDHVNYCDIGDYFKHNNFRYLQTLGKLASTKNSRLSFHRVFICIRILQMAEPVLITKRPGISEICTVSGRLFYGHCRS